MGDGVTLNQLAAEVRGKVIEISSRAQIPHLGSALSCVDILVALHWETMKIDPENPQKEDRDYFILSKGHSALAYYVTLAQRGFFSLDVLNHFGEPACLLEEHPSPGCAPGVELGTGSLGHGLSVGLGLAQGMRFRGTGNSVFVLMSDGECNEGSVWEAALFAPAKKITNITAIIDFNKWQATDRSEEVMALNPLVDKWRSFGWDAVEVDGHSMSELLMALNRPREDKPRMIIAHTVKGKGVSFMEDDNNWHYRIPTAAEVQCAHKELGVL